MAPTENAPPPDAPKTLDFPAVEEARQAMVKRYEAMLVRMQAAMAKVLDQAADEVVRPEAAPERPPRSI